MTRLYAGAWVVTCDDSETEHAAGWLLVDEDVVAALLFSVDRLVVGGQDVVRDEALVHADESEIARAHGVQARRFAA